MKSRGKLIALVVAGCTMMTSVQFAYADDLSDAKSKSESIEKQIEEKKQEIDKMESEKKDILQEISNLSDEVDGLYSQVNQLNSQIDQSSEKITQLENKIVELQAEADKNREIMNKRLRVLYQNNGTGYLDLLLNSKGFGDFLQRLDTVAMLVNFNNDLVKEFKATEEELTTTMAAANEEKATLESAKATVDVNISELEAKTEERKSLMAKAESNIEQAQAMLAQNEEEFNQILSSITAMEEAAKAEAERPSRGDSNTEGGSSSSGDSSSGGSSSGGSSSGSVSTNGMFRISAAKYPITSGFVDRINPVTGLHESHKGIDIGAPYGDPVYSLMDGVVTYSGEMSGYGNVVVVNHGSMSTLYAHNSRLTVSPGQRVSGGQQIAVVGSTGQSTGPHIHFEVIINGSRIDPSGYYF